MPIPFFNEVCEPDGRIRNHYESVYAHWKSLPISMRQNLHRRSKILFSGDYAQDPFPRIITRPEFLVLRRGVEQRARAILGFLHDYYRAGKQWKKVISPPVLKTIIQRHHRKSVLGDLNPDSISFPYGPDIVRDRNGKWRVIEDSAGFIGGMGDLLRSRKILCRLVPGFRNIAETSNDPREFFRQLALYFQKRAREKNGSAFLYIRPFKYEADRESERLAEIYQSLGIDVATTQGQTRRLLIANNGIFVQTGRTRKRVGYLIIPSGPEQMDIERILFTLDVFHSTNSATVKQRIMWHEALNGKSVQGALLKGLASTNFSPGVEFVNDKMFGRFVDKMIKSYLKETPILESIPSQAFFFRNRNGHWRTDLAALRRVLSRKDNFVIKRVDEDGGSGVWIGQKLTRKEFTKVTEAVRQEPQKYIFQTFEHLSVLENRIVDLRIHAQVDCKEIIISNTPWGRANWIHHNGKVNLGSNGFTSPVLVV